MMTAVVDGLPKNLGIFFKFCVCHVILLKSGSNENHIYLRTTRFPRNLFIYLFLPLYGLRLIDMCNLEPCYLR